MKSINKFYGEITTSCLLLFKEGEIGGVDPRQEHAGMTKWVYAGMTKWEHSGMTVFNYQFSIINVQ